MKRYPELARTLVAERRIDLEARADRRRMPRTRSPTPSRVAFGVALGLTVLALAPALLLPGRRRGTAP